MSKGTTVFLKFNSKVVVGTTGLSYALAVDMIETSNKDTGSTATFEAGRVRETISVSGFAGKSPEETKAGFWELRTAAIAGTPVTAFFTDYTDKTAETQTVGAGKLSASVLISNLTKDDPDNDNSTFSCDLQITGDTTQSVNA